MVAGMTSRQRMLAAIHHEAADRVPVAPWGLGRIAADSALGRVLVARISHQGRQPCSPWRMVAKASMTVRRWLLAGVRAHGGTMMTQTG